MAPSALDARAGSFLEDMCEIARTRRRYEELIDRLRSDDDIDDALRSELRSAVEALGRKLDIDDDWSNA